VGVEHIWLHASANLQHQASLGAESASGLDDPDDRNPHCIELGGKRRFGNVSLQKHDHTNIVSGYSLTSGQRSNDTLESAKPSRREKVENL
jgi:hypothetical protein